MKIARSLSIAGSDSGGCAGIQADLKTFSALRTHGMSVITAVTAQDTRKVHRIDDLPPASVEAQIRAVMDDLGADAVKTGMLSQAAVIGTVARLMGEYAVDRLVVDPVMVSSGGDPLIRPQAAGALKEQLLPLALLVTPNLREAEELSGRSITEAGSLRQAGREILAMGPRAVLIKGGHGWEPGRSVDHLFQPDGQREFASPRIDTRNTHGSGCTLAAAITAFLARGLGLEEAVGEAKSYVTEALRHSLNLGRGRGPLGHFSAIADPRR